MSSNTTAQKPFVPKKVHTIHGSGMISWNNISHVMLSDGWHECDAFELVDIEVDETETSYPDQAKRLSGIYAQWTEVGGILNAHEFSVSIHRISAFVEKPVRI